MALGANTTGANNTAVGAYAGDSITTGPNNTLIGSLAGDGITEGSGNVVIGQNAGSNANILTTGQNNILIGLNVSAAGATSNNNIVMGEAVTGQAANNFSFGVGTTDSNIVFGETSITAPSDGRYKENIADSTAGLSFINDLRPVTFQWKKEKDVPSDHRAYVEGSDNRVMLSQGETNHGFIAQEVKAAIDNHAELKNGFNMWSEEGEEGAGGRQRLGSAALIPILVKAIQEQQTIIEALTARITTLEG